MISKRRKSSQTATAVLRTKIPVTQQELAQYLGISSTLLALHEQGARSISSKATIRMAELEMAMDSHLKTTAKTIKQPVVDKAFLEMATTVSRRAATQRKKVMAIQRRLERKNAVHEQLQAWYSFIQKKMTSLPVNKDTRGDHLWLGLQEDKFSRKLKSWDKEKLQLQLQAELAQAAAAVHESFEARLRKGKM